MAGLSILVALFLYLLVSAGVVFWVVRWAKRKGRGPVRWGIFAALVMYHLVFWDFIPTLVVYKYYCATKAGFWVYTTPEQWKAENPGVAETLTWREMSEHYEAPGVTFGFRLNERIVWITKQEKGPVVPVGISEELIIDSMNNKVLVRKVGIWTGRPGEEITRFWTKIGHVNPNSREFSARLSDYKQMGRQVK
jgi:hypothetical protein